MNKILFLCFILSSKNEVRLMDNADKRKLVGSNPAPFKKNATNIIQGNPRFESHPYNIMILATID